MIKRGQADGIQKRPLVKCSYQDCNEGLVKGLFNSLAECHQCNGLGLVDAETGNPLPEREIIRQLLLRLTEQKQQTQAYIKALQDHNSYLQSRLRLFEQGR